MAVFGDDLRLAPSGVDGDAVLLTLAPVLRPMGISS